MREIKFRAWDKIKHVMIDENVDDRSEYDEYWGDTRSIELSVKLGDRYEVMQFTGLRDKNGKEIYDGDILEGRAEVLWGDEEGAWVVAEKLNREVTNHLWTVMAHPVEVIGNIYENPELLK